MSQSGVINWAEIDDVLLDMDGTLLDRHFDNFFFEEELPRRYAALHGLPFEESRARLMAMYRSVEGELAWTDLHYWTERVGIDVVSLNVTAIDTQNHYVTDLEEKDFSVYEDGVKQDLTVFNRTNLPIALALLVDTSASMESRLQTAQDAAIGFARRLRPQDLAEVIDFDSRVTVLQGFTNKAAELEAAIRRTSAGGSTSMYNAVYIALKDLKKEVATSTDDIRRQAIVVLSDGEDTSSLLPFEEVLDLV